MCKDDGAKPATQNNVTESSPWSGAIPYINQGLAGANGLYQSGSPSYYPGQTYAGSNPVLQQGITDLGNVGSTYAPIQQNMRSAMETGINTGASIAGQTAESNPAYSFFGDVMKGSNNVPGFDTLNKYARGDYLSAENPYFKQMADTVRAEVLPSINGAFSQAGRGISGLAGRAQGIGLGDSIGKLAYDNYQQGLGQQQSAAGFLANASQAGGKSLADLIQQNTSNRVSGANLGLTAAQLGPILQNMGINAGNAKLLAGTTQQGLEQGQYDDFKARYDYNSNLPMKNLQDYISNITAQTRGTGTSSASGTSTPAQPSYWNQGLGAGLAAASFFV